MKLAQPINNYCASSACLPNASPLTSATCDTFDQCVILGWGYEDQTYGQVDQKLKQGFVKIYKDDVCDFLQTNLFTAGPTRPTMSACQSSEQGQDACLGDQGGPVLCYDGNRWAVQGIIPFNLCKDNEVSPYVVDVSYSDPWIYDTIRSNP
ncbi:plasminogen-like [Littorina saxatilis]|uniref:Peptidase S1 domain-containing protein n=1 Tax=Littorina saxatilis TaxID=31220 RepID=A0AAN9BZ44_9CAEN